MTTHTKLRLEIGPIVIERLSLRPELIAQILGLLFKAKGDFLALAEKLLGVAESRAPRAEIPLLRSVECSRCGEPLKELYDSRDDMPRRHHKRCAGLPLLKKN